MLTAAVRDLHLTYPRQYVTDVRTPFPALWEHNPHVTPLREQDPWVDVIECHYPLVHRSNQTPFQVYSDRRRCKAECERSGAATD